MANKIRSYTQKILSAHGTRTAGYFFLYAQAHRKGFAKWFGYVEKLPSSFSADFKVRLVMRAAYRFMRPWLRLRERLDLLTCHYNALVAKFSAKGMSALLGKGVQVAELTGKSGEKYIMKATGEISKDGCLRLILLAPDRARLASITGVIGPDKVFWVGALQGGMPLPRNGAEPVEGRKSVAEATKDLNGLRPKQAVLHAACAVCAFFGVKKIVAPSLKNQIAIKNWRKGHEIHTEYDSFWEEYTGGATDERGDYVLALPLPRRKLEDVQQKRRKDWKLRYERVDAMAADITKALENL